MSNLDRLTREELVGIILEQSEEIARLRAEIEGLRSQSGGGGDGAPSGVKANRPDRN